MDSSGFSHLTQFEMNALQRDLDGMEICHSSPAFAPNHGNFAIGTTEPNHSNHRPAAQYRRNHRRSYPPSVRSYTRTTNNRHSFPPPNRSRMENRNVPSARVMEFRRMRRRILEIRREDELSGFPYQSDEQEREVLYYDSVRNDYENDRRRSF